MKDIVLSFSFFNKINRGNKIHLILHGSEIKVGEKFRICAGDKNGSITLLAEARGVINNFFKMQKTDSGEFVFRESGKKIDEYLVQLNKNHPERFPDDYIRFLKDDLDLFKIGPSLLSLIVSINEGFCSCADFYEYFWKEGKEGYFQLVFFDLHRK